MGKCKLFLFFFFIFSKRKFLMYIVKSCQHKSVSTLCVHMLSRFTCVQLCACYGLQSTRLLCRILQSKILERVFQYSGILEYSILQRIFPTQGSDPCLSCLLRCQAGVLLLALPGKSISTLAMCCMFVKRADIFQNVNNHFLWMDKLMGDMNVLSFFTVYFSIYLINHNEYMFLT